MITTKKTRWTPWLAVLASGAALLGSPAHADAAEREAPRIVVDYADLNLATNAGIDALYRRLRVAAREACSGFEGRELRRATERRACYRETLAAAVANVDLGTLHALHRKATDRV